VAWLTVLLLAYYQGVYRGFGGHVNHQELTLLYTNAILAAFPCADRLALGSRDIRRETGIYFWGAFSVVLIFVASYVVIGVARIATQGPTIYFTDTMKAFVAEHAAKDNFWSWEIGRLVQDHDWLAFLFQLSFPFATLLEVALLIAPFHRRWRWLCLPLVFGFHVMIWIFMNIFFVQNLLMLALMLDRRDPFVSRLMARMDASAGGPVTRARNSV